MQHSLPTKRYLRGTPDRTSERVGDRRHRVRVATTPDGAGQRITDAGGTF